MSGATYDLLSRPFHKIDRDGLTLAERFARIDRAARAASKAMKRADTRNRGEALQESQAHAGGPRAGRGL